MKILKNIALVGTGVLIACTLNAQSDQAQKEGKSPEERQVQRMEKIKSELGLTDDQAAQWEAIHAKHKAEREKIRAENDVKKQAKQAEMEAMREQYEAEFAAVLTPEQLVKWKEMKAKREEKMKEHKERKGEHGPR